MVGWAGERTRRRSSDIRSPEPRRRRLRKTCTRKCKSALRGRRVAAAYCSVHRWASVRASIFQSGQDTWSMGPGRFRRRPKMAVSAVATGAQVRSTSAIVASPRHVTRAIHSRGQARRGRPASALRARGRTRWPRWRRSARRRPAQRPERGLHRQVCAGWARRFAEKSELKAPWS